LSLLRKLRRFATYCSKPTGDLGVARGLVRKEDLPAKSAKKNIADEDTPEATASAEEPFISASLIESLTQHRSAIYCDGSVRQSANRVCSERPRKAAADSLRWFFPRCLPATLSFRKEHHLLGGSVAAQALDRTRTR
jgi:hypothetical protein